MVKSTKLVFKDKKRTIHLFLTSKGPEMRFSEIPDAMI